MEPSTVLLHAAAFVAAFFQSVTGIGFGMIAGPVILLVLADPGAVVIATLMSWLIALVLFPVIRSDTDWRLTGRLLAGAAIGLPLGAGLLGAVDVPTLKLVAGLSIAGLTLLMVAGAPGTARPGWGGDLVFGGLGGLFGGALAMPGPTAALRATALGHPKAIVRASMVGFFIAAWPAIFAAQVLAIGPGRETFVNAALLAPATIAGLAVGNVVAHRVSEQFFRRAVFLLLAATSLSLIGNVAWTWSGQ